MGSLFCGRCFSSAWPSWIDFWTTSCSNYAWSTGGAGAALGFGFGYVKVSSIEIFDASADGCSGSPTDLEY